MADLKLEHFDAEGANRVAHVLIVPIYEASHADLLSDPFHSTERFLERLAGYTRAPGFELVVGALSDAGPVGLAFGYTLPVDARWWNGLRGPVPDGFTTETGRRTFAVNEVMTHPDHQRQGIARAVHHELLAHRPEERATLLVDAENTGARAAYEKWGYRWIAPLLPYPDAPDYEAMVVDLPLIERN